MRVLNIFAIFISFSQLLLAQPSEEILSLMTESNIYFERKKYDEAFLKINEAIALDKENAELFYLRGEINFATNKFEAALKDYEKALKLKNEDYSVALDGKILSLTFLGKIKEANELVDKAIENHPSDPNFYYCRGIINSEKEKYAKAIEDFDKALSLGDKNEFRNYLYRGVAKLNLMEHEAALEDMNMAIELDSKSASAYHSRGRVYYESREFEEAIKDFKKSLDFNPQNEVAFYNLGMAYFRLKDHDNACKYFHESCSMKYELACRMVVLECTDQ